MTPSLEEIKRVISETWPEDAVQNRLSTIAPIIYVFLNRQTATNGHCYGMAFTAKDYYRSPEELPSGVDTASQIPKPTGAFNSIGNQIDYVQNTQHLEFNIFLQKNHLVTAEEIDYETELDTIAIDERRAAGVGFWDTDTNRNHLVLAYHYTRTATEIDLSIYDPTKAASKYSAYDLESRGIRFDHIGSEPAMEPYGEYDRLIYFHADREIDFPNLIPSLMYIAVKSPVWLEIDGPEGTLPFRVEADYTDYEATQYGDFVTVLDSDAGEYDITVYGDADGEYALEVSGATKNGELIDEEVSRQIRDGEIHTFCAEVPETPADEGRLQEVDTTEPDDDSPEWIPYAGAEAGAAGLGALLYRYLF